MLGHLNTYPISAQLDDTTPGSLYARTYGYVGPTTSLGFGQDSQDSPTSKSFVKFLPAPYESDLHKITEGLANLNTAHQQLDSPNLLSSIFLIFRYFSEGAPGNVSPLLKQGNIQSYLERNPNADRLCMIHTVADTLNYLHKNGVVHGNLKPSNILIDNHGSIVLCDFGRSHIIDPCNSENGLSSARYAAPEIMDGFVKARTYKSDVYAFASVSIEILTGIKPFAYTSSDVDVVLALYHRGTPYSPSLGQLGLDEAFWDLMTACWNGDPDKRPGMSHVCDALRGISSAFQGENKLGPHRSRM